MLYESGTFRKPIVNIDIHQDKAIILKELKNAYGLLHSSWPAIMHLKQGLGNLGVLQIIKDNKDLLKSFFCYEPPILSPGKFILCKMVMRCV